MQARLRRLAPIILVLVGFILLPLLARTLFPTALPGAMPALHDKARPLAEIVFQDETGQKITLDRFRGSFVLLNIWATWCAPCKEEMPSLNTLASHFPTNDLLIIPVSVDVSGAISVRRYYKDFRLDKLPIYVDPSSDVMHRLAVLGIPTTLLINRDGKEIARQVGPARWDAPPIIDGLSRLVERRSP